MASTSARAQMDTAGRIRNAADTLSSDNQSLIADIRKTINCMKEIAVEMEKLHRSQEVQNLEQSVVKLLENYEDTMNFSNVMQSVGSNYKSRPGPELTDFKSALGLEASRLKSSASTNRQTSAILRNFREAVWNVHHAGQLMPGEEQEDIVMTSTPFGLSNTVCPITGKCVTELAEPVRSMDCKHIFDKQSIMHYIKKTKKCPVAGCPKPLLANRVVCDPLLLVEIEELRLQNKHTAEPEHIEDFTGVDEED